MPLTDEEREHIRLTEAYRAEVRGKLASGGEDSLFDKLAVPVIILIATALISGLLVPWILAKVEDERRAFDLQSRLIEKIVADDATAHTNLWSYRDLIANYRISLLNIHVEKRLLALRSVDDVERQARRAELQDALARAQSAYTEGYTTTSMGIHKYWIEGAKAEEWVALHYGKNAPLEAYQKTASINHAAALRNLGAYEDQVIRIYRMAEATLQTCPDEPRCQELVDRANQEIDELRRQQNVDYTAWDDARRNLVKFISETTPRM